MFIIDFENVLNQNHKAFAFSKVWPKLKNSESNDGVFGRPCWLAFGPEQ